MIGSILGFIEMEDDIRQLGEPERIAEVIPMTSEEEDDKEEEREVR
jgi:hypothetical protein